MAFYAVFRALGMRLAVHPIGDNKRGIGSIDHTGKRLFRMPRAGAVEEVLSFGVHLRPAGIPLQGEDEACRRVKVEV